jgi:hypothetical protein
MGSLGISVKLQGVPLEFISNMAVRDMDCDGGTMMELAQDRVQW